MTEIHCVMSVPSGHLISYVANILQALKMTELNRASELLPQSSSVNIDQFIECMMAIQAIIESRTLWMNWSNPM